MLPKLLADWFHSQRSSWPLSRARGSRVQGWSSLGHGKQPEELSGSHSLRALLLHFLRAKGRAFFAQNFVKDHQLKRDSQIPVRCETSLPAVKTNSCTSWRQLLSIEEVKVAGGEEG